MSNGHEEQRSMVPTPTQEVFTENSILVYRALRASWLQVLYRPDMASQSIAHMDLSSGQRFTFSPWAGSRLPLLTTSAPTRASIISSSGGPACAGHADRPVRLGPASNATPQQQHPRTNRSRSPIPSAT